MCIITKHDCYATFYVIFIIIIVLSLIAACPLLVIVSVDTAYYDGNYECANFNNNLEQCLNHCKCFYCDTIKQCVNHDHNNLCYGHKTINEHCSTDPKKIIILWSVFGGLLFIILLNLIACLLLSIHQTKYCQDFDLEDGNEVLCNCYDDTKIEDEKKYYKLEKK